MSSSGELMDVYANENHAAYIKAEVSGLVSQPANVQEVSAGLTFQSEMHNSGVQVDSVDWSNSCQPQPMLAVMMPMVPVRMYIIAAPSRPPPPPPPPAGIYAPSKWIYDNQDRLHYLYPGDYPIVKKGEWMSLKYALMLPKQGPLFCAECAKTGGICLKEQKHVNVNQELCRTCERHPCGFGDQCTRANLACRFCHAYSTGQCFLNVKDIKKYKRML